MSEIVTMGSGSEAEVTVRSGELTNIFQRGANGKLGMKMPAQSPEVLDALQQVNQLAKDYETLKIEVFLSADRASWVFLSNVYDFVLRINRSVKKRQIKSDLLEMIKLRDHISITSAAETETIVARYIFADMARQTRNNYVSVMQKALSLDVKQGELLVLLEQNGGISNWVNNAFDGVDAQKIADREQRKTLRTDSVSLMRRLFALMGSGQGVSFVKTKQVADWTPCARELATVKEANKTPPNTKPESSCFSWQRPANSQTSTSSFKASALREILKTSCCSKSQPAWARTTSNCKRWCRSLRRLG